MHTLLIGETGSGKTTVAIEMAKAFRARGIKVAVLDPWKSKRWAVHSDFITDNADTFVATLRKSQCVAGFVDESLKTLGRDPRRDVLAGEFRHYGHRMHFLGQRFTQVTPGIRDNCQTLILFSCALDYARIASREYNDPLLLQAANMPKGHYILKRRFQAAIRGRTEWAGALPV